MTIKKVLAGALLAVFAFSASADAAYTWTTSLKLGSRGESVRNLQKFLNMCADTQVSVSGAGSPGMETTYFGPATKAAVIKWQTARGVSPQSGLFGPLSRAKAAELQASTNPCAGGAVVNPSLPAGCTSTAGFSPITGQSCAGGVTTPQTGPVAAMLAASTPAAGYIVNNQASAGLLDIQFSGSGVVNSVTLTRSGISDQNTLSNVYLYDGATRLTDGYSFNSQSQIVMNNLGIMVNGTKVISVKADASSTASNNSTIAVALTGFTAGTSVSTANVQGNMMNLAAGSSLATASLSANTASGGTVNAGVSSYTFWSAPVQVNTRALWLKSAAFRMIGSAPADALSNIRLYVDGVDTGKVAVVTPIQGTNYAMFDLSTSPLSLSTGSHVVDVRANIEKGSSRTIQFSLQQAADLTIMDPQVGVNIAVSGTIPNNAGTVTINSGSVTASRDSAFNAMTNITGGASNVAIAKYKVRAYGEDVKVNSLQILPVLGSMTPTAAGLQNVTVYFNGSQVGTQTGSWSSGNITLNLGSQMIIPAGVDSTVEVRADLRTTAGANYTAGTVSADLVLGSSNAQGQNSYTTISTPAVTGNILTIQTGALGVSKNIAVSNQSISPNTANVKIASFTLQNTNTSEAVRVTSLTVAPVGTGSAALTDISSLKTSETSGSGSNPQQPQATNTFSVDFSIAPGATKTIDVFADTGSTTSVTLIPTLALNYIGASSNVSGTVSAVTGQTMTIGSGALTNSSTTPTFLASSSTSAQYIASPEGKADATKATFTFNATGGSATITDLKFTVTGTDTVTSVKVGSVSAPVVAGVAWLQGLNLVVPNGGIGLNVEAYISYSTVGTAGTASVTSGTTSEITLSHVKYTSGSATAILGSGGTAFTSTTRTSATMIMTAATPTVKKTSSPVNVGTGSTSGVKVGTVTISANDGDIKVGTVPVSIGVPTGGTASNWTVKVNGTAPTGITQPTSNTSGFSFGSGYQIAKGTSVSFDIFVDFAGVTTAGNTDITLGAAGSFTWSDIVDGVMTKTGASLSSYNN